MKVKEVIKLKESNWACLSACEFGNPVYMCFVDSEKAFDHVSWGILGQVLREYEVSGPLLRAIQSLYSVLNLLVR